MDKERENNAARRVVAIHLNMFNESCVVKAVEAWRIWNEFPDQRNSPEFVDALTHFGDIWMVMNDIAIVMSRQLASPTPMFLDDSFILQELFGSNRNNYNSTFLRTCVVSSIKLKFGESNVSYTHYDGGGCYSRISSCSYCKSGQAMRDLGAYIARKRLQAL